MTILIVGATGTLGRQIARRALDEGYQVRCLVRSVRRAAFLKEWGAELVVGNICNPDTLAPALEGVTAIIDAATARATDSLSIKKVDWDGQVALIQAAIEAKIDRFIFFSILGAENYPNVPLMEIKRCTELFLAESGLNYTILRPAGFMQGLIGQYAIPTLEGQPVWMTGESSIAYMDTQDVAKFAVKALSVKETERRSFPIVGNRAWSGKEIISFCERQSGKEAKITNVPIGAIRLMRQTLRFFEWSWNSADRLAFTEVLATGKPLTADMEEVYRVFGIEQQSIGTLEAYLQEYFSRIMRKLKELDYEKNKQKEVKSSKQKRKKVMF
ncbi:SDR family oxidoreductase [Chamaesiphon minutus]|uniref:Putative nucleoside-diphosphate sugar epimerase n=1 Tax=Chamaesiphon minutus (strain ATCC 27169 / PCC 6605) TaxID=1173020 RepID=K9UKI5_CHAP6|nr:SDR family oxidoreductase [Chamaesiphon minutus]AFY94709.1 putative nucleoside-diphosphate sugar epimerase [Chamaesiphon minutus PCC 6605]